MDALRFLHVLGLESLIDGEGLFMVTNLHLSRQEVTTFDEVVLSVDLISCFPCSLDCDIIQVALSDHDNMQRSRYHVFGLISLEF